jgi:hypothetical protein
MIAVDVFCELLAARLSLSQGTLPALAARDAVDRADALFEVVADFSDSLVGYDAGSMGSSVVRESALKVAALAAQLYLATTGGGLAEEIGECPADAVREEVEG